MSIKVLIVDDSMLFQGILKSIINADADLEVIGVAANGEEALERLKVIEPDIITMDVNMPVMDGITTVRKVMAQKPVPILMLSSVTKEGAKATFDALEAGALDFLTKDNDLSLKNLQENSASIIAKIKELANCQVRKRLVKAYETAILKPVVDIKPMSPAITRKVTDKYDIVLIGSSTGGPVAVHRIINMLPGDFPIPIVVIQHMPVTFTKHFAERVNVTAKLNITEARHGEILSPGHVYIAPGGMQLTFVCYKDVVKFKVRDSENKLYYSPCIDVTFNSAYEIFKNKALALILTGMGSDGLEGAKNLKKSGSHVWTQNEQSSVVFGMPCAIMGAGLADKVLDLEDIGFSLVREVM